MVVLITVMNKKGKGRTIALGDPDEVFLSVIGTAVDIIKATHKHLGLKPGTMAKFMDLEVNRMLEEGETHEQ